MMYKIIMEPKIPQKFYYTTIHEPRISSDKHNEWIKSLITTHLLPNPQSKYMLPA